MPKKSTGEVKRPYRLWDDKAKANIKWRCYKYLRTADEGAMKECMWTHVGRSITVYDVRDGAWKATFKRTVRSVVIERFNPTDYLK